MNNFIQYSKDLERWKKQFTKVSQEKKPEKYDVINPLKINWVSPVQAAVEQAKSQLKAVEQMTAIEQAQSYSKPKTKQPLMKKTQPPYVLNLVSPTQAAVEQARSQLKMVERLKTNKQPSNNTVQTMKKRKR